MTDVQCVCLKGTTKVRLFISPYEQRHGGWPLLDACFGPGPSEFLSVTLCVHMKEQTRLSINVYKQKMFYNEVQV